MAQETPNDRPIGLPEFSFWKTLIVALCLPFRQLQITALCVLPPLLLMTVVEYLGTHGIVYYINPFWRPAFRIFHLTTHFLDYICIAAALYAWSWAERGVAGVSREQSRRLAQHVARFCRSAAYLVPLFVLMQGIYPAVDLISPAENSAAHSSAHNAAEIVHVLLATFSSPLLFAVLLAVSCGPALSVAYDDGPAGRVFARAAPRAAFWRLVAIFLVLKAAMFADDLALLAFRNYVVASRTEDLVVTAALLHAAYLATYLLFGLWFATVAIQFHHHIRLSETRNAIAVFD